MSRASVSRFGRSQSRKFVDLDPTRIKPKTLKFILVASKTSSLHYEDKARIGWFSVRIMWVSRASGHGTGSLTSQWGSTKRLPPVHTVASR